jgi:hypothetical protein
MDRVVDRTGKRRCSGDRRWACFRIDLNCAAKGVFGCILYRIHTPISESLHWLHWLRRPSGEGDALGVNLLVHSFSSVCTLTRLK